MQSSSRKCRIEDAVESKNYMEFERLRSLIRYARKDDDESKLKEALKTDGDVNYQDPNDGCTLLHLASRLHQYLPKIVTETMIDNGADPTTANNEGQTVVHYIFNRHDCSPSKFRTWLRKGNLCYAAAMCDDPFSHPNPKSSTKRYIGYLLNFLHVRNENTTNYVDVHGVSHFHAACAIDHMETVEFFLNNGVSVDEAVKMDSPKYAGYTPLHFAAECGYIALVEKLLDRGAGLLEDSRGMTPLHLLVNRNMEIVQRLNLDRKQKPGEILAEVETKERIIKSILSKTDETMIDRMGLFPFYVMCAVRDDSRNYTRNYIINKCINFDSTFWPGYTALHFAAHFDIDTVKLLLERGANIEAKDAYGVTPFDLCVGRYSVEDIHFIISSQSTWRNVLLSDGKTKLLELVLAMRDPENLTEFLAERDINEISVPHDSPLWPGFGILHLAVTLSKKCTRAKVARNSSLFGFKLVPNVLVEVCLRLGADVVAQDRDGSTPIHLAFRRMDLDSMYVLLKRCSGKLNPTDKDSLSLLHIACAVEDENLVRELLSSDADKNSAVSPSFQWDPELRYFHKLSSDEHLHVWPGSTPLHVAIAMGSRKIVTLLMEAGADLYARDANGLSPLHRAFVRDHNGYDRLLNDGFLSRFVTRDCVIDGLSYLHIAVVRRYPLLAKKLLKFGADVNSTIVARDKTGTVQFDKDYRSALKVRTTKFSYFLECFEGDTPLHLIRNYWSAGRGEVLKLLMRWGADVLAKNSKGQSPICKILEIEESSKYYVSVMSREDKKRLFDEMGLTKLHVACRLCDVKMIKKYLRKGAKVNARIRDDSGIWPGYTPLHVLVRYDHSYVVGKFEKDMCMAVRLLLKAGADVTIADAKGETPLMLNIDQNHIERRPAFMDILWEKLRNSTVNPISDEGISHFHLAGIRNDVAMMERLMKLGADPHQRIAHSSDFYPNYTPLHFALHEVVLMYSDSQYLRSLKNTPTEQRSVSYRPYYFRFKPRELNVKTSRPRLLYKRFRRLYWRRRISIERWMRGLRRSNSVNSLRRAPLRKC